MIRWLYNKLTYFWYHTLGHPIHLKVTADSTIGEAQVTVVFLHGIAATSDVWQKVIRQIHQRKELNHVRLIALDLLGFGKSLHADWLDYDYLTYETAIQYTLEHLHLTTPVILVGHSMGALIAADFVTNFPDRYPIEQLILVSPPVLMSQELAKLPDRVYIKSYSSLHQLTATEPAIEVIARLIQRFSSFHSDYLKTKAFESAINEVILNRKNYHTFTSIRVPTLLIHGHFDPLVVGANLARAAKHNSRYITYTSVLAHHDITSNKRVKIVAAINKYLDELSHETL